MLLIIVRCITKIQQVWCMVVMYLMHYRNVRISCTKNLNDWHDFKYGFQCRETSFISFRSYLSGYMKNDFQGEIFEL